MIFCYIICIHLRDYFLLVIPQRGKIGLPVILSEQILVYLVVSEQAERGLGGRRRAGSLIRTDIRSTRSSCLLPPVQ